MNLEFYEIQEIQKISSVSKFEDLFHTIENKAFELRGRSTDFYTYLNELFKKENIDKSVKVMLLKYLTAHKGNWKHDFLKGLYESLKEPEPKQEKQQGVINENQHPKIFDDGAFDIFVKWVKNSNDEQVKSISFIFQKLKKENKLRNTTFKVLSEWAFNNNYLNEESYNKLLTNGCFVSPSKILTKTRLALYNSIIGN